MDAITDVDAIVVSSVLNQEDAVMMISATAVAILDHLVKILQLGVDATNYSPKTKR